MAKTFNPEEADASFGFDVTCVIGRVIPSEEHSRIVTPGQAAMLLIAEHDASGVYTFPMPDGNLCRVTVEYEDRS